jgi:large subunit ribosomal protein L25
MAKTHIQMTADKREGSGKGTARAVRRNNRIPAVIYGDNKAPVLVSIEDKPITLEYHKGHLFTALCDLNVAGEKHLVITRDLQLDPVTDRILHADFLRVTEKTVVRVEVPVHFIGHDECPALKEGATLTVVNHEIPLMCPANNIPDEITIDIAGQPMGHSFKLADVKLPNGVKGAVADAELFTIATLAAPRKEEEISTEAPTAGEVPASQQAEPAAEGAADGKKDEKK